MTDVPRFCRMLRLGHPSMEFSPNAAADLIENLSQERDGMAARIRELENLCLPNVQAAERTGYARGFRAATMAAAQLEHDPDTADAIARLQPNFALATEAS